MITILISNDRNIPKYYAIWEGIGGGWSYSIIGTLREAYENYKHRNTRLVNVHDLKRINPTSSISIMLEIPESFDSLLSLQLYYPELFI